MAPARTPDCGTESNEIKGAEKTKSVESVEARPAQVQHPEMAPKVDIIDIRHDAVEISLRDEILKSLKPKEGPKRLPTLLLYDERGLQLFEDITYLEEYYLTNAEIEALRSSARKLVEIIPSGSMVVELGSGNLRKVSILLEALDSAGKDIDYYALDLSLKELYRTLEQVPAFTHVRCHGLHGTYDDGLDWLKTPENRGRTKCILSLGSSIGNFSREGGAKFLKGFSDILEAEDSIVVGLDATSDPSKVYHAYNDREGTTHKFILNGLSNANGIYKEEVFKPEDWKVIGEYVYDADGGRHQAFCSPVRDVSIKGIEIKAGERIQIEESLKYSPEGAAQLWKAAGLVEVDKISASSAAYNLHILKRDMAFKTDPSLYASSTIPTLKDWEGLWAAWDLVTRGMIPEAGLNEKPIKLRNACIFYLGHIPTFVDIQLTRATQQAMCEPSYYPKIFERGIDPDVDNPERCHDHSEVPEEWPPVEEILAYQKQVRAKIEKLTTAKPVPRDVGRALWIGFEHEILHLETILYMLLQSDKTLPPSKFRPDFEGMASLADATKVDNEWFDIPEQRITIGLSDPEDNSGGDSPFGWDNEKPARTVVVPAFRAQARAITNEDYARYLEQTRNSSIPASWAEVNGHTNGISNGTNGVLNGDSNGDSNDHIDNKSLPLTKAYLESKSVRTVYGLVPLKLALGWPIFASFDELAGCAKWMDGRIPTFEEARSIYSHVDGLRLKEAEQHLGKTVPAVNGHLVNDGVEESPPSLAAQPGGSSQELFTNLENANVGFKHWHPVAVTPSGNKLAGQADMGGVWEWTSSPLVRYEGFEPMKLYPAYTADFFDGKHNIVLGGSWATHPRIAGRKTFVNWYQRNYPYAWAGARLVRDL